MAGDRLESAKTIDASLAADLRAVGIADLRDLRAVGAADAWERLFGADLRDTLAARLALEAAVRGRRVALLEAETRERCAAHVQRRLAVEPPGPPVRSSTWSLAPPRASAASAAADRRRARTVHAVVAGTVVLLAVMLVLVAALD